MSTPLTADEMAAHLWMHPKLRDGGVAFCRRASATNKAIARNLVLRGLGRRKWDRPLKILTMPSVNWMFEKALIQSREHGRGLVFPRITHITAIEQSPYVYRAALATMPGTEHGIVSLPPAPYAKQSVRTKTIGRFHLATLADMAEWQRTTEHTIDVAWLDFTGPLSFATLDSLRTLWESVNTKVVITSLRARWTSDFMEAITEAGGIAELLMADLPGSVACDEFTYMDTSPMHQITLRRFAIPSQRSAS